MRPTINDDNYIRACFKKTRNHKKGRLLENAQMLGTARLAPRRVHKGTQASKRSRDCATLGALVPLSWRHTPRGCNADGRFVLEKRRTGFNRDLRLDVIEQIAASLAHGIRNPLTVIKGYLQFCQSNPAYCTCESFNLMMQEVECIEELISSLISLVRNKAIEKSPQDLNQMLIKLFPVIQAEAIQHGITAELCLGDKLPVLEANMEEIRQLIINLARNGLEAMSGSGRLIIGTGREAGNVVLSVQDEGSGISLEQIKKIFDPFYTTKGGNAGLGLAIGLSIVERHQGNIQIASNIGEGTTVRVVFPIFEQHKEFLDGK